MFTWLNKKPNEQFTKEQILKNENNNQTTYFHQRFSSFKA